MHETSATPSAAPLPIPITRAAARAIPEPPAEATSWSSNATIDRLMNGRSPASSSATCAWTTTSASATSAPPAMSRRPVWCATSLIRPSTRSDRSRLRSKSEETPAPGSTSSAPSRASTSKARNTAARTTGPSGAGTLSTPRKRLSSPPEINLPNRGVRSHRAHPRRTALRLANPQPALRTVSRNDDGVLVQPRPLVLVDRQGRALPAHRGVRPDRPTRISAEEGSTGQ